MAKEKDIEKLRQAVIRGENNDNSGKFFNSGNIYKRENNNSTAKGAYQFTDYWSDKIKEFAAKEGYKYDGKDSFLNNSTLQDDFFKHYVNNYMQPEINMLKSQINGAKNLTDEQLQLLYHKFGAPQLKNIIQNNLFDKPIYDNDISPNEYLKRAGVGKIDIQNNKPIMTTPPYNVVEPDKTKTNLIPLTLGNDTIKFQEGGYSEPPDYTDKYNTPIPPGKQKEWEQFAKKYPQKANDKYDYDVQGAWLAGAINTQGHSPDTYKKPNHPTFSNESIYSGKNGNYGGNWTNDAFQPTKYQYNTYGKDFYSQYTNRVGDKIDFSRFDSGSNKPILFIYEDGGINFLDPQLNYEQSGTTAIQQPLINAPRPISQIEQAYTQQQNNLINPQSINSQATGRVEYVPVESALLPAAQGLGYAGNILADVATGSARFGKNILANTITGAGLANTFSQQNTQQPIMADGGHFVDTMVWDEARQDSVPGRKWIPDNITVHDTIHDVVNPTPTKSTEQIQNLIPLELNSAQKKADTIKTPKTDLNWQYKEENGKYYVRQPKTKSEVASEWRTISKKTYDLGIKATDEDLNFRPKYGNGGNKKLIKQTKPFNSDELWFPQDGLQNFNSIPFDNSPSNGDIIKSLWRENMLYQDWRNSQFGLPTLQEWNMNQYRTPNEDINTLQQGGLIKLSL